MITKDEAFLIFDKLRAEQAMVFCTGRLWGWNFSLRGKIVSACKDEIILVSADRTCGSMSIPLDTEDLLIRYIEPREVPFLQGLPERDMTLASLMISLPLRMRPVDFKNRMLDAPPREVLFFLELPPEK